MNLRSSTWRGGVLPTVRKAHGMAPSRSRRRGGCSPRLHMTSAISPTTPDTIALDSRSKELRKTIVRALTAGKRGHVGAAFSVVEILRVLYDDVLTFDAKNPRWPERDRFILSKGHGCL